MVLKDLLKCKRSGGGSRIDKWLKEEKKENVVNGATTWVTYTGVPENKFFMTVDTGANT